MMKQGSGNIINISSLGGLQAWPSYMHYCASKAALISLTRTLAKALAPTIRVNSVAPGTILFPQERRDERIRNVISTTPLRKAGSAEDIAQTVLIPCHPKRIHHWPDYCRRWREVDSLARTSYHGPRNGS